MTNESYFSNISKLLCHPQNLNNLSKYNQTYPITLDIAPTNKCNLNCDFCSVHERDKSLTINHDVAWGVTKFFIRHGLKSIEITGGGEPTLWEWFNSYVRYFHKEVKLSLFTNGIKLPEIPQEVLEKFTWIRVSINHIIDNPDQFFRWAPGHPKIGYEPPTKMFNIPENVELSFNYVWAKRHRTGNDMIKKLEQLSEFVEIHRGIIKIQENIFDPLSEIEVETIRQYCLKNDSLFFSKKSTEKLEGKCYMQYIKPHLHADNKLYRCAACAGLNKKHLPKYVYTTIGNIISDYSSVREDFDNSDCMCFYGEQNKLYDQVKHKLKHWEFV